jgi:tRNA pseudouridine-54 N-methylase
VLRVDGRFVRFVRPDERQLALLVQKALARVPTDSALGAFVEVRAGLAVARGGLEAVLSDLGDGPLTSLVLEEGARDVREVELPSRDLAVFVGDHRGFAEDARARLAALGAVAVGVGPVSVHADDAITLVCNELDRRDAGVRGAPP